jgi:hypothetical protein
MDEAKLTFEGTVLHAEQLPPEMADSLCIHRGGTSIEIGEDEHDLGEDATCLLLVLRMKKEVPDAGLL